MHSVTDRWTDGRTDRQTDNRLMPIADQRSAKNRTDLHQQTQNTKFKTLTHMTHLTETSSKNYNKNITQNKSGFKL